MTPRSSSLAALACVCLLAGAAAAADRPSARSPDGRLKAWIKSVPGEPGASGEPASALWITDLATGRQRELLHGRAAQDPTRNLASLSDPDFSLDGGYVYVEADAYATSPAIHQVDVRSGAVRYVADGALLGVLRNGPWRGYLVVEQHRYRRAGGSIDPVLVLRPDGHHIATVPGGERALAAWLRARRWTLS